MDYSPWSHKGSDITEHLSTASLGDEKGSWKNEISGDSWELERVS